MTAQICVQISVVSSVVPPCFMVASKVRMTHRKFVADLCRLTGDCEFGAFLEEVLRDNPETILGREISQIGKGY